MHFIYKTLIRERRSQACHLNALFAVRRSSNVAVKLDDSLTTKLQNEEIKPKKHPGIVQEKQYIIPGSISQAIIKLIKDYPVKNLLRDGKVLNQYIISRHPPPEVQEIRKKQNEIRREINERAEAKNSDELTPDEYMKKQKADGAKVKKFVKERIYSWKPIIYDNYKCLLYAIGRSTKEYAVLMNILREIEVRDPDFKPKTYFDFGSGLGSGMWAASTLWSKSIFEYFNVDSCKEMNELADLILRDGNENQQPTLRHVYYRQFLPASETAFDLVVCSYSLFELPSAKHRLEIAMNLWRKCSGYLVIIEEGSRKGSDVVNEVRDYILSLREDHLKGTVFSPCPHDRPCPRQTDVNDSTPCNFESSYEEFSFDERRGGRSITRYSYVVLKKGASTDNTRHWPRLVRPTLLRHKHIICRMCTMDGNLEEIIFTTCKHGRDAYRCAKASTWGDRLPIEIEERPDTTLQTANNNKE